MNTRPARLIALAASACVALMLSGCSEDVPTDVAADVPATSEDTTTTTEPSELEPATDVLSGTWATPPITEKRLRHVALQAGFSRADVDDFFEGFTGHRVIYTLKLGDGFWVAFESVDGQPAHDDWSGPYEILDDSTVRAGEPPCGPITYTYRLDDDQLHLDMTKDDCIEGGVLPVGEMIAQTTIYESAPFSRIG